MATVRTSYREDMLFETHLGRHTVTADVPDYMGGQDRGPLPTQLFVTALSSCISAMVAEYCKKNGFEASGMTVEITYEKASAPTRLTNLSVRINLPKAVGEDHLRAIEQVAMHCPVQETIRMMGEIKIDLCTQTERFV